MEDGAERDGEKKSTPCPNLLKSGWGKAQKGAMLSCFDGNNTLADLLTCRYHAYIRKMGKWEIYCNAAFIDLLYHDKPT